MKFELFTVMSREAIADAQRLAVRLGNPEVRPGHLLAALLVQKDGVLKRLCSTLGVSFEALERQTAAIIDSYSKVSGGSKPMLSRELRDALDVAATERKRLGDSFLTAELLVLGLADGSRSSAELLRSLGVSRERLVPVIEQMRSGQKVNSEDAESLYDARSKYTVDVTRKAAVGELDEVIGRNEEIQQVFLALARRTRNHAVLVGPPGVGKTAIVWGLARRLVAGDLPAPYRGKRLLELSLPALVAGAKYRGEFEQRLYALITEIERDEGQVLLLIDDLQAFAGIGKAEGCLDAAALLSPALARGKFQVIGTATGEVYRRLLEERATLMQQFQAVPVSEPSPEETLQILLGIKGKYEAHHGLRITDQACRTAVARSRQSASDRAQPDRAIDLVDAAASSVRAELQWGLGPRTAEVTEVDVAAAAAGRAPSGAGR